MHTVSVIIAILANCVSGFAVGFFIGARTPDEWPKWLKSCIAALGCVVMVVVPQYGFAQLGDETTQLAASLVMGVIACGYLLRRR